MRGYFFYALLAALCWGIAPVFEKLGLTKVNVLVAMFLRAGITLVVLAIILSFQKNWPAAKNLDFLSFLFIFAGAFFSIILAQYFYFRALNIGETSKVVAVVGIYPLLTMLCSFIFLHETITTSKAVGIIFVIIGLQLIL